MRIDRMSFFCTIRGLRAALHVLVALTVVGMAVGCASVKNPAGTVAASFFQNPDRVWEGIQLSLETLDYVVESSNRTDGTLRAAKTSDDQTPWIALDINQIANTQDQVKVYVRGVPEDPADAPDQATLDKAAQDFVTVLKRKLGN